MKITTNHSHFFLKKTKKENFTKEQEFIHSVRKYKDKIHRLKAEAADAAPSAGVVTLDSHYSPQTKIGSCRMQFIYTYFRCLTSDEINHGPKLPMALSLSERESGVEGNKFEYPSCRDLKLGGR